MRIYTHPDNLAWLRWHLPEVMSRANALQESITVHTNPYMEREVPSGRVILPNGSAVKREDFQIRTRFITYGPEDLHYFLWTGEVRLEMQRNFIAIASPSLRFEGHGAGWGPGW